MPTPPATLFRYERFSTQSLLNLKRHEVHFGSPRRFNDPYDCAIKATIVDPTDSQWERALVSVMQRSGQSPDAIQAILRSPHGDLKKQIISDTEASIQTTREEFLSNRGVACFSEVNDDLLMWSHYGGKHSGFCLELRTGGQFERLRKVKYVESMPKFTLDQVVVDHDFDILDLYCTKSIAWNYEREWRGIHETVDTNWCYGVDGLKAVYFGPEIAWDVLEVICLVLKGQNPNAQLWRGRRSDSEFMVEFDLIEHTSFADRPDAHTT